MQLKKPHIATVILGVLFFLVHSVTFAQVVLTDSREECRVENVLHYRSTENLSIREIAKVTEFKPLDFRKTSSLGFDTATHWFWFEVSNQSTGEEWLIEIAYAPLDYMELYTQDALGQWQVQVAGDHFPLSSRQISNRHVLFSLNVPTGSFTPVCLKIRTESSIQVPVTIWSKPAYQAASYTGQFAHGVFYGIMIIMIFYNLFLFFSIKDRSTLYYIFTLLSGTNVIAFFQGYGFFYLYPEHPGLGKYFSIFSAPLFIVSSIALTRSFLQLKTFSLQLDRLLLATSVVTVVISGSLLFSDPFFSYRSLHVLTVMDFVLILVSASYCFMKKYRPARYFLLAWTSLLLVGALFSFRNLGLIQTNWFTNNALYFGGIMQTLLISFALGDKINLLTRENQEAKERELKRQQETKWKLESEVKSRTEEIRQKKEELELSNTVKDKLFSVISHDLKGPLNSLKGALNVLHAGAFQPDEFKKISEGIGEQLQQTSEFLDNLLQWAKTQMEGHVIKPEKFSVREIVEDSTALLAPEFEKKKIELDLLVRDHHAFADPNMIRTVVRNLVSNALKFTLPGGRVQVNAQRENGHIVVSISDTGVGIPREYIDTLFTLQGITTTGTREEKGTGIGLVLCKEFIEKNGGTIHVKSEENKGTTFQFSLPHKMN